MAPRQWQPIVAEFSRVMKLVHLATRMDQVDIDAIASDVFKEKRRAYEDELTALSAAVGCVGKIGRADNSTLSTMHDESQTEAFGIANTYNYDLALVVRTIRSEVPTANRYVYAKRIGDWSRTRAEWKSKQIMLWNTVNWRDKAQKEFIARNGLTGYAIVKPRSNPVCDVCRYWVKRGKVSVEEANQMEWPAHLNCPHNWEYHTKKVTDCDNLWVGLPVKNWYDQVEV